MELRLLLLVMSIWSIACNQPQQNDVSNNLSDTVIAVAKDTTSVNKQGFKTVEVQCYPNNQLRISGKYLKGKRDSLWTSYYENGVKWSECEYSSGLKSGKSIVWHENGTLYYIGYYEQNIKKGIWKFYDDKGTLIKEENYN